MTFIAVAGGGPPRARRLAGTGPMATSCTEWRFAHTQGLTAWITQRRVYARVHTPSRQRALRAHRFHADALRAAPRDIRGRRDLRRLDLAASAPEHVRVQHGHSHAGEMRVDRALVCENGLLLRTVRHRHDVHVC